MHKLIPFALALITGLLRTACGGGSADATAASGGTGTATNPVNVNYLL